MKADDIGLCQKLIQGSISAVVCFQRLVGILVIRQYLHAQCLRDFGCTLSNPSKADDAKCLSGQLHQWMLPKAPVGIVGPLPCLYAVRMLPDVMAQLQQKGNGILCHCIRTIGWNVGHDHACRLGCRCINHIVARSQHSDEL